MCMKLEMCLGKHDNQMRDCGADVSTNHATLVRSHMVLNKFRLVAMNTLSPQKSSLLHQNPHIPPFHQSEPEASSELVLEPVRSWFKNGAF